MISFVYFDIGGVVIKDFSKSNKWSEFMANLGLDKSQFEQFEQYFDKVEGDLCLNTEFDSLLPQFKAEFKLKLPVGFSLQKDMVGRFEPNPSIWPIIETCRKKFKNGLLTNMYVGMFKEIQKRQLLPKVAWDVIVDSSVVKLKKPDPKIFELAEKLSQTNRNEILFVENSQLHIAAAKKLGWETYLYDSGNYEGSSNNLRSYLIDSGILRVI